MQITPMQISQLRQSVVAVPPLARNDDFSINKNENKKLIQYLEDGGVKTLLYGGNANFYNISLKDFETTLSCLNEVADENTLVIPSIGPSFGFMNDQVEILKDHSFPTVMVLPTAFAFTESGVATGIRHIAEKIQKPLVLYIKNEGYMNNEDVAKLVNDNLISVIKYAIVRQNPERDDVLSHLVEKVNPSMIMSGIGEQPAITHLHKYQLGGYTSGCVCIAPQQSTKMLQALVSGEIERAEHIRKVFEPLENLRNSINPIRVLHEAVSLAEIAETGPHYPNLSPINADQAEGIKSAADMLKHIDLI